jgi:hypothetical protein
MTDDESKRIILSRRARFVAAALASAGLAAGPACGGDVEDGSNGAGGSGGSGGEARDASRDRRDEPQVCLSPPGGFGGGGAGGAGGSAGSSGGVGGSSLTDAPMPCLSPPIDAQPPREDASATDAGPQPCLAPVK